MTTAHAPTPPKHEDDFTKKHVLLVDDDPGFRSFACMLLTKNGYRVSQACDGSEALRSVEKFLHDSECFDLLFTDLKMEPMSGMELIREIQARGLHVPVLIATGFLDEVSLEELQQIETYQFLIKPFKAQDLLRCAEQLTDAALAGENKRKA